MGTEGAPRVTEHCALAVRDRRKLLRFVVHFGWALRGPDDVNAQRVLTTSTAAPYSVRASGRL
jgi:hypothetical protein